MGNVWGVWDANAPRGRGNSVCASRMLSVQSGIPNALPRCAPPTPPAFQLCNRGGGAKSSSTLQTTRERHFGKVCRIREKLSFVITCPPNFTSPNPKPQHPHLKKRGFLLPPPPPQLSVRPHRKLPRGLQRSSTAQVFFIIGFDRLG